MRIFTSLALAGLAAACISAGPAEAAAPPKPGLVDFDRDGYGDLVIGAPDAAVGGKKGAGNVAVVYGSRHGLDTRRRQNLNQDRPGVADVAEADDRFGYATAVGDFNGDGYTDLAVGAPNESSPGAWRAGLVTMFLGGPKRLRPAPTVWNLRGHGDLDLIGASLASGNISGDSRAEVAATGRHTMITFGLDGELRKATRSPVKAQAGPPSIRSSVAIGDINGDGFGDVIWNIHDGPLSVTLGGRDGTGPDQHVAFEAGRGQVAVADVNGDRFGDVIVGRPGAPGGGRIAIYPGSRSGKPRKPRTFSQDTRGVPGKGIAGDGFGSAVAARDVTGDRKADLLVGAPGKDLAGRKDAGAALVLPGHAGWALGTGSSFLRQEHVEIGDRFGGAVTIADFDGDRKPDLAVGAPGENQDSGAVTEIIAGLSKLNGTFGPSHVGAPAQAARFGFSLSR